jgi:AcrR family transcriptional regulator
VTESGLRDRKKAQTRQRIADVAAGLIAERGYDAMSMAEVARAAEVSEQTVYNYFPAKQDLVLDRAEQIRQSYGDAVRGRGSASPATALAPSLEADVERYRGADLELARGEFPAQSVASPALRRFTLQERERQVATIADAIAATTPEFPAIVAHAHAAALVAVIQAIHDRIGRAVLDTAPQAAVADELSAVVAAGLTHLDRAFTVLTASPRGGRS